MGDDGYQMLKPEVRLRSSRNVSPCHVEAQGAGASVGASKSNSIGILADSNQDITVVNKNKNIIGGNHSRQCGGIIVCIRKI